MNLSMSFKTPLKVKNTTGKLACCFDYAHCIERVIRSISVNI